MLNSCATGSRSDTAVSGDELTPGQLRFDGMYYRQGVITPGRSTDQNYTYLRFYSDGTLLRVATASKPDDASKWLNKRRYPSSISKYKIKNDNISFGWENGGQIVTYDGQILEDKLRLSVYSGGNDYTNDYFFMQMDFAQE
jgi:hypothetical protein